MTADRAKIRDVLAFHVEAGVDVALGETANDYLSAPPVAPAAPESPAPGIGSEESIRTTDRPARPSLSRDMPVRPPVPPPPSADTAVMAAREAARSAASLDELRAILEKFDGCALKATASRLVFADGNPQAKLMLVGEAPGREEDIEGLPFVGRSGKLLDLMLKAIGMDRTSAYIANIVPWRPPGNRTPTPVETQICLPFLLRQIALVDPDIVVTMGNPSTQTLLQINEGITKTRGRWFAFNSGPRDIRVMPTFHPAFLLRSPLQKRFAWRDFLAIKKALG